MSRNDLKIKIGVIGIGHLGSALVEGFVKAGFNSKNLFLSNQAGDNRKIVESSDYIVIAVKPIDVGDVFIEIKDILKGKIIISCVTGVSVKYLESFFPYNLKIVRIMPNIPVSINKGVMGVYFSKLTTTTDKNKVKEIFSSLGEVVEVQNEHDIDLITLIGGCGPAIVSYFVSLFENYAKLNKLDKTVAKKIALGTFAGTLEYLKERNISSLGLQQSVATKAGVTAEILSKFDEGDM